MKEGTEHYDAVKAGYGGRARRGNSKPGGYDMTGRGPFSLKLGTFLPQYDVSRRIATYCDVSLTIHHNTCTIHVSHIDTSAIQMNPGLSS